MSHASGRHRPKVFGTGRCPSLALIAMMTFIVSACSSGPPPKLYLLEQTVDKPVEDTASEARIGALGLTQVILPGYASDARIASLESDGVIVQLDRQRWAEDPEDALSRLFAQRLRQHSNSSVLIEPWPRDYGPVARIEVVFDQLYRLNNGGAHLSGHIQVLSGDGRRLVQSLPFDRIVDGQSQDATEFFKSVAVVVNELALDTIDSFIAMESAS